MDDEKKIDIEALRRKLADECTDAFLAGGFGAALMDLTEVENADAEELLEIARRAGLL